MAVNYKKGLRTYENEKFDRKVTVVGDEDDDQPDYEEIAEYVDNPSEEKRNQNKYTGWNERGKSKSRNSHKKKFENNRNENAKDIDLQLPTKQLVDLKVVSRKWRTACVVSAFVCVGLMSALLWLMLSTKASPCEYVQCLHNGNCSVSGDKAICNCHDGFYGLKCEGTPCVNYSCNNGGTCFLDEFQPKCACKNGFTGDNCTIYVADFEDNMDSMFIQDLNSDHNWKINSNSTDSTGTGPSSAYKGDYYLYFETSLPVSFEAVRGTNFTSDIAIDDIQVLLSSC
ncbi:unnamed protein product [Mytilus coruscus]|uniref:EGF-like domain-containing protein n=1 Tax=Mytilus coruscus TaxID=42192 RepID=A0A6J8C4Y6_MYTCO|nr:unnamed protein product [Mytilus coruscus]